MSETLDRSRRGRFEIPWDVVEDYPGIVRRIMAECVVVRCESLFAKKTLEYEAYADAFEPVPEHEQSPVYDVEYDQDTGGVSWTRQGG